MWIGTGSRPGSAWGSLEFLPAETMAWRGHAGADEGHISTSIHTRLLTEDAFCKADGRLAQLRGHWDHKDAIVITIMPVDTGR
ncbi:hypothetical protein SAMN05444161_6697 [Rhizobiales bacterium GAS191]|nr:hypothetical protein SAMN05519103_05853 [Rhizobiales bacterium GAS113]SEE68461.1 hypothetical protein SAMN05444161_6697 [Rhizobiales bacterium GAS191]